MTGRRMKMPYKIDEIRDKEIWNNFCTNSGCYSFLQSWEWSEFQLATESQVFRMGVFDKKNTLRAIALFIKVVAKRGKYLLCPHGPIFNSGENKNVVTAILTFSKELAIKEKCDFVRICSLLEDDQKNAELFDELGFSPSPIHTHPELSWILNIEKNEDELLSDMRKTTRYMIRKAQKENVVIEQSDEIKTIEKLWPIYKETAQRQKFTPFSKKFLKKEFEIFSKSDQVKIFLGKYNGETVVAAMIVFFGDSAFYHHSGSLKKHEKIGISYLLQWEVIKEAKRRGLKKYNFWGISPDEKPSHPWAGLSLFKKGFGGYSEHYLRSRDFKLKNKYYLNYLIETVRKYRRGYH